jgi:two-component system, chemotaxis family, protein-glutamate methylesterase/glutaminase
MLERVNPEFIAVGASAGGVTAIRYLLGHLSPLWHIPIGITQHLPSHARIDVDLIYNHDRSRRVVEVEDKMPVESGHVYMAAPGYHMLIEEERMFALSQDETVNHSRPSIDVFFQSVAEVYGSRAVGILLTGANSDGAQGLAAIAAHGGVTIVQDPREAENDYMPRAGIATGAVQHVMTLSEIVACLDRFMGNGAPVRPEGERSSERTGIVNQGAKT